MCAYHKLCNSIWPTNDITIVINSQLDILYLQQKLMESNRAGQDQGGPYQQHYVTSLSQG